MHEADDLLTVVLLLRGRNWYTARWMDQANATRFPFKILIADGGPDDSLKDLLRAETFPNLDFEYIRFPFDNTPSEFHAKVVAVLERVTTPFVVKSSNDDFYSVEGLREAVRILVANPDVAAARGRIFTFSLITSESEPPVYGRVNQFDVFKPKSQSLLQESAQSRVKNQCWSYASIWHDTHRTGQLLDFHRRLQAWNPQDLRFAELLTDLLAVAAGKVVRGDFPYALYQANPAEGLGAVMHAVFPTPWEWAASSGWREEFESLTNEIALAIATHDQIPLAEARSGFVKEFTEGYIGRNAGPQPPEGIWAKTLRQLGQLVRAAAKRLGLRQVFRFFVNPYRERRVRQQIVDQGCWEFVGPILKFMDDRSQEGRAPLWGVHRSVSNP